MTPEERIKNLGLMDDTAPSEAEWTEFRGKARRSVLRRRVAGALGGVALLVVTVMVFYVVTTSEPPHEQQPLPGVVPATERPSGDGSPSGEEPRKQETVALQQWFVEDEKLMLSHGQFLISEPPARRAIEALLRDVPGPLAETGVETYIPEETTLQDLSFEDETAHVTLRGEFPDDSDTQQDLAMAQIVYTLTQFPTIDDVVIAWESPDSGPTSIGPERRSRFHDYLPQIVVEEPYAGEVVGRHREGAFILSGIANVFEGTLTWRLVDTEHSPSRVIETGFVTATCGSGCWGTFNQFIRLHGRIPFFTELQVFESSAEDGSPLHMVKIPLHFGQK